MTLTAMYEQNEKTNETDIERKNVQFVVLLMKYCATVSLVCRRFLSLLVPGAECYPATKMDSSS